MEKLVRESITSIPADPKTFNQIFKVKNKWVPIQQTDKENLVSNFWELVEIAYHDMGGHLKVKNKEDLLRRDWDVWYANDVDEDPQADVVFFGKRTPFGVKVIGVGHDGGRQAKREAIFQRGNFLFKPGAYIEASGKPYMILRNKFNIGYINDPSIVQTVLNKEIKWHGKHPEGKDKDPLQSTGWYSRPIGGKWVYKIMMGKPNLDNIVK